MLGLLKHLVRAAKVTSPNDSSEMLQQVQHDVLDYLLTKKARLGYQTSF
jgi:hypothetical protein